MNLALALSISNATAVGTAQVVLLSSTSVDEDATQTDVVGALSATFGTGPYTYAILLDPDSKFAISGSNLVVRTGATFSYPGSHSVTVRATDSLSATSDREFTISVNQVAPSIVTPLADVTDSVGNGPFTVDYSGKYAGSLRTVSLFEIPDDSGITIDTGAETITIPDAQILGSVFVEITNGAGTVYDDFNVDVSVANGAPEVVLNAISLTVPGGTATSDPEFVGSVGTAFTGSTASLDLTSLTGGSGSAAIEGDTVFVVHGWASLSDDAPSITSSGYTILPPGSDRYANSTRDTNGIAGFKVMGATPDTEVTLNGPNNGNNGGSALAVVFRNLNPAMVLDVAAETAEATNTLLPDPASITPLATDVIIMTMSISGYSTPIKTLVAPANMTGGFVDQASSTGSRNSHCAVAWHEHASGAFNPDALTLGTGSDSTSDSNLSWTLSLRAEGVSVAPVNTAVPTLSGTTTEGETLTSTTGTWTGDATITYAYQWQRSDDGSTGWADIPGATASTYDLVSADATKYVRSEVTATNSVGSVVAVSAASAQIAAASGGIEFVGRYAEKNQSTSFSLSLTSLTGGIGTAPIEGDLVVVHYGIGTLANRNPAVTGYTSIASLHIDDVQDTNLRAAYKVMTATPDTSVSVTATNSSGSKAIVLIEVWRGVDTTTPMDVTPVTASGLNTVLANPNSITPVTAGAKVVACAVGSHLEGAQNFASSDLSNVYTDSNDGTNDVSLLCGSVDWTSGAVDPAQLTFGGSDSTNYSWASVTYALRPA